MSNLWLKSVVQLDDNWCGDVEVPSIINGLRLKTHLFIPYKTSHLGMNGNEWELLLSSQRHVNVLKLSL